MSHTVYFPLDAKSFNILREKSNTTQNFSDYYFDDGDNTLAKRGCFLMKRCYNNNDTIQWILNDKGKITYSEDNISRELNNKKWRATYDRLFSIHDIRRFYLGQVEDCKVYIDEINFSLDEYYLIGTIMSEQQNIEKCLTYLEKCAPCEVLRLKCRSSILEYIYGYKPKLYDYLKEKKIGLEDVKYCCSRRSNRPNLDVDGKSHKISFEEAQGLWHHIEDYLDDKYRNH